MVNNTKKLQQATEVAKRDAAPVAVIDLTRADHYARASRADRTWAQYRSAFRLFSDWCSARGLSPMPAASETLRAYVASLADEGRTIATVNAYVAAIASAHSIAKKPFDRGPIKDDLRSKAGNGEPVEVIIPCPDMPVACAALEAWVTRANLKPGEPVFRPINKGGEIGTERLGSRSVALIIKARVRERAIAAGQSEVVADASAELCSGHSLRAGYCTAAALAGTPEWKIRRRSRHKTAELVARYVRAAEQWTDSGLKNIGF
jgi:hypothetical protein